MDSRREVKYTSLLENNILLLVGKHELFEGKTEKLVALIGF